MCLNCKMAGRTIELQKAVQQDIFHDDGLLKDTPEALGWAAAFIDELSQISGLKTKWLKTKWHPPTYRGSGKKVHCGIIQGCKCLG